MKTFTDLRTQFDEIGYPIGWRIADGGIYPAPQACTVTIAAPADVARTDPGRNADGGTDKPVSYACGAKSDAWMWASVLMGWLTTAIAIMLGAPFWFNLLNKLISLRTALKPPSDDASNPVNATAPPAGA